MKPKFQKKTQKNKRNIKVNEQYSEIFNKKVRNYVVTLKWGKGSTNKVREMLIEVLGKPCYYCGKELTLDNIQLDHKKPMLRSFDLIDGKLIIQNPPAKDFIRLNRPQNLRFICEICNLTKGHLPENEFKKLIEFLNKNKRLKGYIKMALYHYNTRYSTFNGFS